MALYWLVEAAMCTLGDHHVVILGLLGFLQSRLVLLVTGRDCRGGKKQVVSRQMEPVLEAGGKSEWNDAVCCPRSTVETRPRDRQVVPSYLLSHMLQGWDVLWDGTRLCDSLDSVWPSTQSP